MDLYPTLYTDPYKPSYFDHSRVLHPDIRDSCISQDVGLLTGAVSKLYLMPDDIQLDTC